MLILLTSPDAILLKNSTPDPSLVALLKKLRETHPVALISNHVEPAWFKAAFAGSKVQFLREFGRQNGQIVSRNAEKFSLQPFDVIVLATKKDDVQMGKNGGAVLIAAGWSSDTIVKKLGIEVANVGQLDEAIALISKWDGNWWFKGDGAKYGIRALADLSTFNKSLSQATFAQMLTRTVKQGGARLTALLAVVSKSLLMDGVGTMGNLVWGTYPSSSSQNNDSDVLADFTHRLRTTVSKFQYAARGQPLFVRHTVSQKRSGGGTFDRSDPTDQITTLHLNPFYKTSNRLQFKNVVVVDDCTTYGASFGVASALLRKAGAASVTGIALGKFGNKAQHFDIDILTDPFKPIAAGGFILNSTNAFASTTNGGAQDVLRTLIQ